MNISFVIAAISTTFTEWVLAASCFIAKESRGDSRGGICREALKEKNKSFKSMMKGVLTKHNKFTDPDIKLKEEQEAKYQVYLSQKEKIAA